MDNKNRPKDCGHCCSLSVALKKCCSCLDQRPVQGSYALYMDGRRFTKTGSRGDFYCPICKELDFYNSSYEYILK